MPNFDVSIAGLAGRLDPGLRSSALEDARSERSSALAQSLFARTGAGDFASDQKDIGTLGTARRRATGGTSTNFKEDAVGVVGFRNRKEKTKAVSSYRPLLCVFGFRFYRKPTT